jgi:hypothetical protein
MTHILGTRSPREGIRDPCSAPLSVLRSCLHRRLVPAARSVDTIEAAERRALACTSPTRPGLDTPGARAARPASVMPALVTGMLRRRCTRSLWPRPGARRFGGWGRGVVPPRLASCTHGARRSPFDPTRRGQRCARGGCPRRNARQKRIHDLPFARREAIRLPMQRTGDGSGPVSWSHSRLPTTSQPVSCRATSRSARSSAG